MLFKLIAMTPQGERRSFGFLHTDLEAAYAVVQTITQLGNTLLEVTLIDEWGNLPVPVDRLNHPSNPIEALRQPWETWLAQPIDGYLAQDELTQRLVALRQAQIASIHRTLSLTQELIARTHHFMKQGLQKTTLLTHYEQLKNCYSRLLAQLEADMVSPCSPVVERLEGYFLSRGRSYTSDV